MSLNVQCLSETGHLVIYSLVFYDHSELVAHAGLPNDKNIINGQDDAYTGYSNYRKFQLKQKPPSIYYGNALE